MCIYIYTHVCACIILKHSSAHVIQLHRQHCTYRRNNQIIKLGVKRVFDAIGKLSVICSYDPL